MRQAGIAVPERDPGRAIPEAQSGFPARLPVEDAEDFCKWCLTDFSYKGQTIMMAPGSGFYTDPSEGRNEVRLAYVLNREDLGKALEVLAKALEAYNAR